MGKEHEVLENKDSLDHYHDAKIQRNVVSSLGSFFGKRR